jgi:hypothetical protein
MVSTGAGLLERYRKGQRQQVWQELRDLGDRVREPGLADEAQGVCDEMARRARHNVDVVVGRLREQGYRFHVNDSEETPVEPFHPPGDQVGDLVAWLDERFGPVPMVLSSWLRLVGDVWLVGTHPEWPESSAADPLVLEVEGSRYPTTSMREHYENELEAWREWADDNPQAEGFVLPVAPDALHKANVSGGDPYGVPVPDSTAEGLFVAESPMPFVTYLNVVFQHGGFPGEHAAGDAQQRVKQSLADGLLEL